MIHKIQRMFGAAVVTAALLAAALPVFAQGGVDYRFDSLTLPQPASVSPALLHVAAGQAGFQLSGDSLDLLGVVRCASADPACGLDGQALTVSISGGRAPIEMAAGYFKVNLENVLISSYAFGGQSLGSLPAQARGRLAAGDQPNTARFQMVACAVDGSRTLGLVLNGTLLTPAGSLDALLAAPGDYSLIWQNLGGTAHLTETGAANPICDGRDLGVLFSDGYTPQELPGRSSALPAIELPEGITGRVDRDIVIEATTARLRNQELWIGVRGYFFGQCGVQPQASLSRQGGSLQMTIYRAIPDGTTCTGGVESFSLLLPYMEQDNLFKVGNRVPVEVNGQIIAILIGL